jgi:hypothetical protein
MEFSGKDELGGFMKKITKLILIFLVTVYIFDPITRFINPNWRLWALAGLIGAFILFYDTLEMALRKKNPD